MSTAVFVKEQNASGAVMAVVVTWRDIGTEPDVALKTALRNASAQVVMTAGTGRVHIEGSNDGKNFQTLTDGARALVFTQSGIREIAEPTLWLRVTGDASDAVAIIMGVPA